MGGRPVLAPDEQMTLGDLIDLLVDMPPDAEVWLTDPHSYRGDYSELAFERTPSARQAAHLLKDAQACVGKSFRGWKGGQYQMSEHTMLWVAFQGQGGTPMCPPDVTAAKASTASTYPQYNPDATCPKCRHDDVSTRWQDAKEPCRHPSCLTRSDDCAGWPERLQRRCERCRFGWFEAVEDSA